MAIDDAWRQIENVRVVGDGVHIHLRCPLAFVSLLRVTLSGWYIESAALGAAPQTLVREIDGTFEIDSLTLEKSNKSHDITDALNFLILCIAYLYKAGSERGALLHGAAFREGGKDVVVFGRKGAGKSSLAFSQAVAGSRVYADDLIYWDMQKNEFVALGLPLRMRRPIPEAFRPYVDSKQFVVGERIVYSRDGVFDVAEVGCRFFPDVIKEFDEHRELRPIPLFKVLDRIRRYSIDARFTEVRNKRLDQ